MKVLVVGGGGREHALAWSLGRSPQVETVLAAPGNPGIAAGGGECVAVSAENTEGLLALAAERRVDLAVVGPEAPLVGGLADRLTEAGVPTFGPGAAAARLEGSKVFAKEFLQGHGIPTAAAETFADLAQAQQHIRSHPQGDRGLVVKADGLAAGKGVLVTADRSGALQAAEQILAGGAFGAAGARILVEEKLEGEELSVLALCDGRRALLLPASQDHKRLLEGDQGPNTGGMGAYSPAPLASPALLEEVRTRIVEPTLAGMAEEGCPFRGLLYVGLMVTAQGLKVLEFNVRFGDPEAQVVLPRLSDDLVPYLVAAAAGELPESPPTVAPGACVGVVLASAGYPRSARKGDRIEGLEEASREALAIFHAGTRLEADGSLVTAGGRVLCVVGAGDTLSAAAAQAYSAADCIRFEGRQLRRDIGARALARES